MEQLFIYRISNPDHVYSFFIETACTSSEEEARNTHPEKCDEDLNYPVHWDANIWVEKFETDKIPVQYLGSWYGE